MKILSIPTLLAIGAIIGLIVWGIQERTERVEATQKAEKLQEHKTADSTLQVIRAMISEKEAAVLKSERDAAATQAAKDAADRSARDNQTALMIAMMSRPSQEASALRGLIEGGFLSRDRYRDTLTGFKPDSAFTASVAMQGKVLIDTRAEVGQLGLALLSTQEQMKSVNDKLSFLGGGLSDVRTFVQDRRAEAKGVFATKRRAVLGQVDARLGALQQSVQQP